MLISALIMGLLGSFHCIGMCGPIAFMLPLERENKVLRFMQVMTYHAGRIMAYAMIGLIFGAVGAGLNLFGLQQNLSIFAGIFMILITLLPSKRFGRFRLFHPFYKTINNIKNKLGIALKRRDAETYFFIGVLNGFLPCGLVYLAVFGALATAQLSEGLIYMVFFGLGTIPLMTTAAYAGNFLNVKLTKRVQRMIPVVVVLIGVLFILRGLGLGIPYISPKPITNTITSEITCHS